MTSYFALCDWVIWLAADNCREARFTDHQMAAFEELCVRSWRRQLSEAEALGAR